MVAILLALASSLGYGGADFAGGLASRDAHVFRVVAAAAPAGLLVNLLLLPVLGADWSASAVAWGAGSGLASAAAFTLLYQTLALGPMSILSPLTAVISAVIPVGVGILEGERLGAPAFAGLLLAMLAIILVGGGPSAASSRPGRRALVLAIGAGGAIATQLICLHQAPAGSGLAPLLAGSVVSSSVLLGAVVTLRRRIGTRPPRWALAVGSGALSALATWPSCWPSGPATSRSWRSSRPCIPARRWCWRGSCWANASAVSRSRASRQLDWPCAFSLSRSRCSAPRTGAHRYESRTATDHSILVIRRRESFVARVARARAASRRWAVRSGPKTAGPVHLALHDPDEVQVADSNSRSREAEADLRRDVLPGRRPGWCAMTRTSTSLRRHAGIARAEVLR
jgi:drug/metabolite transporter (DMT)-like permease